MAPSSRRGVLVSLLLPVYLPAGLSTTAQTLLVPFLPLWLPGSMWSKCPFGRGPARLLRLSSGRAVVALGVAYTLPAGGGSSPGAQASS